MMLEALKKYILTNQYIEKNGINCGIIISQIVVVSSHEVAILIFDVGRSIFVLEICGENMD